MEGRRVERTLSSHLNETIVVYKSDRKPGFVYRFNLDKGVQYTCCRCQELGKKRTITVRNDVIVGRKHPEDGHQDDCLPISEHEMAAQTIDRQLRQNVREHGKRPREAYNDMLTQVAKKFKDSSDQVRYSLRNL